MNLDDMSLFQELDTNGMIEYIRGLPDQLMGGWNLGEKFETPNLAGINQIFICGAGSSFIAAQLLRDYLQPICKLPVTIWREFEIPLWAKNEQCLVIISGFSGDEKELRACLTSGMNCGCKMIVIATGGDLIRSAKENNIPFLQFEFSGPSRAALGYEFVLPLAVLFKLELIPSPKDELFAAASLMKKNQPGIDIESPVVQNTAKRMAGQFLNRWVTLFGSGFMQSVADRWKSQINENAKAWAQVENISDTCHSTLGGIINPESQLTQMMTLFLISPNDKPQNQARLDAARRIFLVEGFNTDFYRAKGSTLLENMWSAIQFGDFISYYLAIAYKVDPTPVPGVAEINSILN